MAGRSGADDAEEDEILAFAKLFDEDHDTHSVATMESVATSSLRAKNQPHQSSALETSAVSRVNIDGGLQSIWKCYADFARKNRAKLMLADSILERYLWWIVPADPQKQKTHRLQSYHSFSNWRSVVWSVLQLHRLAFDLALNDERHLLCEEDGTTLPLDHHHRQDKWTFRLRLGLTVIQTLWPICNTNILGGESHEDIIGGGEEEEPSSPLLLYRARSRRFLERLRFLLRATFLVRYWSRCWNSYEPENYRLGVLVPGLLRAGGTLLPPVESFPPTATLEQKQQRLLQQHTREAYVGKRTGRRFTSSSLLQKNGSSKQRTLVSNLLGELLYIVRPWFWAEAEVAACNSTQTAASSWNVWLYSLGLDVASLYLTSDAVAAPQKRADPCTCQEWKRRRMRLMLYLLRSPIWERWSHPVVGRLSRGLETNMFLLGHLLSLYLQDWIYFWKEYRLEEG